MRKLIIGTLALSFLLPSLARAEVDGAWLTESKPGWWFVLMDGINPSSQAESIGMTFQRAGMTTWEMYFGPKTGTDAANLGPWLSNSNMQATWSSTTSTGTLTVLSCTEGDCPFNTGEEITFTKVFGDGIDPPDGGGSQTGITPGLWTGDGICFFVNAEGTQIVESDQCDSGKSFSAQLTGVEINLDSNFDPDNAALCDLNSACVGAWDIVPETSEQGYQYATAKCANDAGGISRIAFSTGDAACIIAFTAQDLGGGICFADGDYETGEGCLLATPAQ